MPVTIPIEAYEELEKGLGKEGAKKVVKALESVISDTTEYKWKVTKDELLDGISKEFVTKGLFEAELKRVEMKLNFLIILMIIALTLMNPVMAEIIKGLLKL